MKRLIFIPLIFLLLSCEDKQESIENNVPVANDISIMTNEDVAVSIGYSDNNDATLVYEVVDTPTNGSVSNGIYTPDSNFNGEDSLTYRAYDGDLYSERASVTITVHAVNDAPEFSEIGNQQVDEGETLAFTISATDVENESISFSIEDNPDGSLYFELPTEPTLVDNNDGTAAFSWASSFGDAGNYNVTFRASDGTDHSDEAIVISVGDVNQPPVADAGEDDLVNGAEIYQLDGSGSFDPDGQVLTYDWTVQEGITLDSPNIAGPTFKAPNVTQNTDYIFTLVVSDGVHFSEGATVIITVLPIDGLYINEFLARNDSTNTDEYGEYDDWLEIYNAENNSIDLGDFYLTDTVGNLTKWRIPDGTVIQPQSFLLFWCDEDQEQGVLHTNFKLRAEGEFIALVNIDGVTILDSKTYGEQSTDISYGRVFDGSSNWDFLSPTPGSSNGN